MRVRLWPRSLAARTALVLLLGLAVVQMAGLTIHALDRLDVQRLGQARSIAVRVVGSASASGSLLSTVQRPGTASASRPRVAFSPSSVTTC